MGTNYYAVKKLSDDVKEKIIKSLSEDKYEEARNELDINYRKIHIGKSSYGWKFLFNYNHFQYYDLTRESINDFISSSDITLYDEYGGVISADDFWEMVESKKDGLDNRKYYEKSDNVHYLLFEEMTPNDLKDKYDVEFYEFYSNGLRFSSSTEFS